jgi:hypothetical protein
LGHTTFYRWLTDEPVERPREIRIFFLLKLYFVQRFIPEQTAQLIEQQITACSSFLKHLESRHPVHPETSDEAFLAHVVLRSRIHQTQALLDWLHELQQEMRGLAKKEEMRQSS